jgi:antitoxin ParD1/3/4/toxin ParE1/3/4
VKHRFTFSPDAASDLEEIRDWVNADGGPRVALHVIRSLLKAIRLLAQSPNLGHTRKDLTDLPLKFWPVFSWLIVYYATRSPIEVVRVLHAARNLPRILSGRT